ncbi:hypothetical protein CH341_28155, partial [Rhodoplanes roseus]
MSRQALSRPARDVVRPGSTAQRGAAAVRAAAEPGSRAAARSLPFHPLADLFPLINGAEFEELVDSIRAGGLNHPIVLLDGMILDGRNRYRALARLVGEGDLCGADLDPATSAAFVGFDPRHFRKAVIDRGPLRFVIDENLRRRHLSESQRAMLAARIATFGEGRPPAVPRDPSAADTPPIGGV